MGARAAAAAAPIGVIGVGNMGLAMAERLLQCGRRVVVRDIRLEAEASAVAAGASTAGDCADVAERCDLLIVAVVDAAQCDAVLFGEHGAHAGLHRQSTVMVCSTIGPRDMVSIVARLAERAPCIDAPMSGGPARARAGSMSLMVACAEAVFDRHETVLRELSSRLVRVGERIGDGARTKLVNNMLAGVNLAAAAEALALAERLGLDARRTLQVFEQSSAQSWIASDRLHVRWMATSSRGPIPACWPRTPRWRWRWPVNSACSRSSPRRRSSCLRVPAHRAWRRSTMPAC